MDYLEGLNQIQRAAVENTEGPTLVIAGAGSGKTRVLTYRIAHLLSKKVIPYKILALTFTNKAAREMKERISNIVDKDLAKGIWMGTFHSTFAKILRFESDAIGYKSNFTIYDSQDSKSLIRTIIKELRLDDKIYKPNDILSRISSAKNNLVTAKAYSSNSNILKADAMNKKPMLADIYTRYEKRCKQADAMDFDDLLLQTNILFRDHPDILAKYQSKFKYLLVDEYQDTNYSQYLIVKKLVEKHKNVCVVGDDAQSIYSFRGAKIENILNFRNDYPGYKLYKLEQNYRSTQTIVEAANSVIRLNTKQIEKNSFSANAMGEKIRILKALTDHEEGHIVSNDISRTKVNKDLMYKDFAILYRTNAQSRIFEESLRRRSIPYKIYGGLSFYQRKEVKDVLAYFRLTINPYDEEALKRVINYPKRGIGLSTIQKINEASFTAETSMWEIISSIREQSHQINTGTCGKLLKFQELIESFDNQQDTLNAYELALKISTESGIIADLNADSSPEGISRQENIQELLNGIQELSQKKLKDEGTNLHLSEFLEEVALLTDQDIEGEESTDRISLMTIHSAKGLEFPHVYIVGMEEELFPSQMTSTSPEDLEEERRLFYVAVTRAESRVSLSFCKSRFKWGKQSSPLPSRFIKEIDEQYIDYCFTNMPKFDTPSSIPSTNKYEIKEIKNKFDSKSKIIKRKEFSSRIKPRRTDDNIKNFKSSPACDIQSGMNVEHPRFGKGKVLQLSGTEPEITAIVYFEKIGQKQLLLKFAKLKII